MHRSRVNRAKNKEMLFHAWGYLAEHSPGGSEKRFVVVIERNDKAAVLGALVCCV